MHPFFAFSISRLISSLFSDPSFRTATIRSIRSSFTTLPPSAHQSIITKPMTSHFNDPRLASLTPPMPRHLHHCYPTKNSSLCTPSASSLPPRSENMRVFPTPKNKKNSLRKWSKDRKSDAIRSSPFPTVLFVPEEQRNECHRFANPRA